VRFQRGFRQQLPGGGVGVEGLAFVDSDRAQGVDHRLVPGQPGLGLDEPVQNVEEVGRVGDGCVEHLIGGIDESGRSRVVGIAEWVDPNALAVCDGPADVVVAAAVQVRPQKGEARVRQTRQHDVPVRYRAVKVRRKDQVPAPLASVRPCGADVFQRVLPAVVDAARDRRITSRGRHLQHHRTVSRVEKRHQVDGFGIGCQRLVSRIEQPRPVDDPVVAGPAMATAPSYIRW
jgi:hypothetical protein